MNNYFWLENISILFNISEGIIPNSLMTFENQLNALSRLVIILFFILYFYKFSYDIHFLIMGLTLIIMSFFSYKYYFNKLISEKKNMIEYYGKVDSVLENPKIDWNYPSFNFVNNIDSIYHKNNDLYNLQIKDSSVSNAWCPSNQSIDKTYSLNHSLVGNANPKTFVRPIIPNPIYDADTWLLNDFVIPTGINDQKRQELYQNGYTSINQNKQNPIIENFQLNNIPINNVYNNQMNEIQQNYRYNQNNYNKPSSLMDLSCGYHPVNLDYNLPINYNSTECQRTNDMKEYNKNLFSIPIQPNIYTSSQINQPYSSMYNLGISETEPFPPVRTLYDSKNNNYIYQEYIPSVQNKDISSSYQNKEISRNEIYDPRLTGYGTSYRSYIDEMTGQPRFYYDDINQQTQPNYISRNNLDIYSFAPQTGAIGNSNINGYEMRDMANNNYMNNQLQFRTELQQRLMHKNNNREWQQRQAPISTNNTWSRGGGTMSGSFR